MNRTATNARLNRPAWLRRVAWLIAIWAASVAALGVAALALKLLFSAVGMTS